MQLQPLEIGSSTTLRRGDPLYILSFAFGAIDATQSRGRFVRQDDDRLLIFGFSTPAEASGAPVVDGSGQVVGMHYSWKADKSDALSVETITQAIRREVPEIMDAMP